MGGASPLYLASALAFSILTAVRRIDYLKAFAKSGEHAALALLTLAAPIASAVPLAIVIGAALYVTGWVLLSDRQGFKAKIDAREAAVNEEHEAAALLALNTQRATLFAKLIPPAQARYEALVKVCADIEKQLGDDDPTGTNRMEKLDGLMWSYLGLLTTEHNLREFLAKESEDEFETREKACVLEINGLKDEIAKLAPGSSSYENKFRLLGAKEEGCEALRRRHEQYRRASENIEVVRAEQVRIEEQLKLLRADLYATQSAGQFTQRINDTIDTLASGSRIASDVTPTMPGLPSLRTYRLGYAIRERS